MQWRRTHKHKMNGIKIKQNDLILNLTPETGYSIPG